MITFIRTHAGFLFCAVLFAFLLMRNPFSDRTLIPNFEPYPDALYYLAPARALVSGLGPYMVRDGRKTQPIVPPLYSLSLVPFYLILLDPRMAYVGNVFYAFLSLLLLYRIVQILSFSKKNQFLLLFLYVSNFYVYWYPTVVMAENIVIPLVLLLFLLLLRPLTNIRIVLFAFLAIGLYATKYANAVLSFTFLGILGVRIFFSSNSFAQKCKDLFFASSASVCGFLALTLWGYFFYQKDPLLDAQFVLTSARGTYFSLSYMHQNFWFYFDMLLGKQTKVLWQTAPLLPRWVALLASISLGTLWISKKTRFFGLCVFSIVVFPLLFLSTFYSPDARYALYCIPIMLLCFGFFLDTFEKRFLQKKKKTIVFFCFALLLSLLVVMSMRRLKEQVGLNLRHVETPWYAISVRELNSVLTDWQYHHTDSQAPVVVSALPPYFVDLYLQKRVILLPLHAQQEFRSIKKSAFGPYDFDDLDALYTLFLRQGRTVFVEKYGLGNEEYLRAAFSRLFEVFDMQLIHSGCFDQCSVYELHLKH